MTDPTPDPLDEQLRAALQAEADGVTAGPDLLEQVRRAAAAPPSRRVAPWLLAAAAVALVAGVGAVLLRDGDQELDVSNGGDPTTTTTEGAPVDLADLLPLQVPCEAGEVLDMAVYMTEPAAEGDVDAMGGALVGDPRVRSARFLDADAVLEGINLRAGQELDLAVGVQVPSAYVVDLADGTDETAVRAELSDLPGVRGIADMRCTPVEPVDPPPLGQRPTVVALVREDGWLVTIDLASGQARELHFVGDPNESTDVEEGGPYFIDAVDLSPDGQWVYFSTCCEPAVGQTFRIPVDGGEPQLVGFGAYPRVSPDGQHVAIAGSETVSVVRVADIGSDAPATTITVACCSSRLAWSPDGSQLALVNSTGAPEDAPQVLLFDWDGATLTPADMGKPDNPGSFASWTPDGTLDISSGDPVEDDRSLSQDASHRWLLWVDEEGVVRAQDGHQSGDRTVIVGLPEALAADW